MRAPTFISTENIGPNLKWADAVNALSEGHKQERPQLNDIVFSQNNDGFLNRAAWIPGIGPGLKTVTIFPENTKALPARPTVQGVFILFDEELGNVKAIIDSALITYWKTAADSLLGAKKLARKDASHITIIGAGAVGLSSLKAYTSCFTNLKSACFYARNAKNAKQCAAEAQDAVDIPVTTSSNLLEDVKRADIVVTATPSVSPVLLGDWVSKGTHVDLIGAYAPNMREADNALLEKSSIYVDNFDTTLEHIGELKIPLAENVINRNDVLGDLYTLSQMDYARKSDQEITAFKNGGGAHLDLMIAEWIYDHWLNNNE